jgi:hypothetical protein
MWYVHPLGTFLLGDTACDRIVFNLPLFETVYEAPPSMVLAGHGEPGSVFKIGGDEDGNNCKLMKDELQLSLSNTEATVWLISTVTVRYSGARESPKWTLLASAAAQVNEEGPSLAFQCPIKSGVDFFRQCQCTHGTTCDVNLNSLHFVQHNNGNSGQQHPHNFGPGTPATFSLHSLLAKPE